MEYAANENRDALTPTGAMAMSSLGSERGGLTNFMSSERGSQGVYSGFRH